MLFVEPIFIFVLLPITLLGVMAVTRYKQFNWFIPTLLVASCVFYAAWNIQYLAMLLGAIYVNYIGCRYLSRDERGGKLILAALISLHLTLLGFFKYTMFIASNVGLGSSIPFTIILPLAISFYTFQQISFAVDVYRKEVELPPLRHYFLYILFFPQLIAGPIVQFRDVARTFANIERGKHTPQLGLGIILFSIGFCKKVFIADMLAPTANAGFMYAEYESVIPPAMAWLATLSYGLQLYFDFSGYVDMAIGLGLMFGIVLPINFKSPYRSANISDFWKTWHITLGRFLREYLYIPLGGSKGSHVKTCRKLFIVMVLGGIWHGAGWGFLLWGVLHGSALVVYHTYKRVIANNLSNGIKVILKPLAITTTFCFVMLTWIPFRAESLQGANIMIQAIMSLEMTGLQGQLAVLANEYGIDTVKSLLFITIGLIGVFLVPNSQVLSKKWLSLARTANLATKRVPSIISYSLCFMGGASSLILIKIYSATPVAAFLYFQF